MAKKKVSKKKHKESPAVKVETIEEFLARGGEIQQCEPQEMPEQTHQMKPVNTPHPRLMSIVDGQFFFAEKQKRKVDQNKKFLNNLSKTNLPQDIIDKLKSAVKPSEVKPNEQN